MISYSNYFCQRLNAQDKRIKKIIIFNKDEKNITGKKRKYEEAMGYSNDYEVVQDPESIIQNKGYNWIDAYLENLSNK
jgi:hypothetical protein